MNIYETYKANYNFRLIIKIAVRNAKKGDARRLNNCIIKFSGMREMWNELSINNIIPIDTEFKLEKLLWKLYAKR